MTRNQEIERIYMSELRDVETAVYVLEGRKANYEMVVKKLSTPIEQIALPREPEYKKFKLSIGDFFGTLLDGYLFGAIAAIVSMVVTLIIAIWFGVFIPLWVMIGVPVALVIGFIVWCIVQEISYVADDNRKLKNEYYEKIDRIKITNKKNITLEEKRKVSYSEQSKALTTVKDNLEQYKKLREHFYSVNWIPLRYRKIDVVYYICDMVTTSEITMDEALHYYLLQEANNKLDTIIRQMNQIIEQQKETILNQAVLAAQNDTIRNQNVQLMQRAASIEENAKLAADYAQIAADYAEAGALFGLANYFKK